MLALLSVLLLGAAPAVVTSAEPEAVSVTVYRDPHRRAGALSLDGLNGSALVTETRTVDLPAGPAEIRFEGVADGIIPVSAIVTGLPGGTVEKNRDARLLSAAALADGSLGRRLTLRRTDRATGRVREEAARLVAGPAGGLIVQTAEGVLALGCSGLTEAPVYGAVPDGLSARPTLSVTTTSRVATRVTVQLSYLADDFDWEATYSGRIGADGRTIDLFAWLTLANGNGVSFRAAQTMAVAGELARDENATRTPPPAAPGAIRLRCWPRKTTSDIAETGVPPIPPAPSAPPAMGEIMVTAQRRQEMVQDAPMAVLMAEQESLGDLKLYRIPEPVTVAAQSLKQVALLTRRGVPFATIYSFLIQPGMGRGGGEGRGRGGAQEAGSPARIVLRLQNREKDGLGLPLPSGRIAVMAPRGDRDLRVGEGDVDDTAVGQEANLSIGESAQVQGRLVALDAGGAGAGIGAGRWRYVVSNANPFAVSVEAVIGVRPDGLRGAARRMATRNGLPVWTVRVPANSERTLAFETAQVQ
ncbi:hypothetical protein LWE61_01850 [Sphingobium sufflavum]|uniref:DUF4139 domain-containing protein n=1 Tax=Sphingobium sufflavum TaxID=1129547 RepID=UPI001F31D8B2|nr:hypothetical protein [Sphingobium sufflavum]MCE7795295.1 hypothetical protein [Sphingobium sufflavum]